MLCYWRKYKEWEKIVGRVSWRRVYYVTISAMATRIKPPTAIYFILIVPLTISGFILYSATFTIELWSFSISVNENRNFFDVIIFLCALSEFLGGWTDAIDKSFLDYVSGLVPLLQVLSVCGWLCIVNKIFCWWSWWPFGLLFIAGLN